VRRRCGATLRRIGCANHHNNEAAVPEGRLTAAMASEFLRCKRRLVARSLRAQLAPKGQTAGQELLQVGLRALHRGTDEDDEEPDDEAWDSVFDVDVPIR
jgi:hypothetical protein